MQSVSADDAILERKKIENETILVVWEPQRLVAYKDGVFPSQARWNPQSAMNVGMIAANNFQGQPALELVKGHDGMFLGIIIAAGGYITRR